MNFSERRRLKAKNIDTDITRIKKNQARRIKSVGETSDTLDTQLKQLSATRQTLPPIQNAEDYTFPVENRRSFHPTAGMSGIYNDDDDVAFWAGSDLTGAIWTAMNPFQLNPPQGQTIAPFVVTHGGTIIANQAIIRGNIFATDGVFNGTVYAKDGKFTGEVNATSGTFNGKVQTFSNGSRIVIDPDTNSMKMYNSGGQVIFSLDFTVQNYNGVEYLAPKIIMNHWVNNEIVYWYELTGYECRFFDQSGNQSYIRPDNVGGLNITDQKWGFGFGYDGLKSCLSLSATNLPTSASSLLSGRIWRDGTLLRIVP